MPITNTNNNQSSSEFRKCMENLDLAQIPPNSVTDRLIQAIGGRDAFCSFPLLDLGEASSVKPEEMSHSIMRAQLDKDPLIGGIAIKTKSEKTGLKSAEVFFRWYPHLAYPKEKTPLTPEQQQRNHAMANQVWVTRRDHAQCPIVERAAVDKSTIESLASLVKGKGVLLECRDWTHPQQQVVLSDA